MLEKIKIEGFKSIRELELTLSPINLLIGSNGVGKSNFISFFKLVNNIYEQRLRQYSLISGVDNLFYYGRKNTSEIKGYLDFGNNAYAFNLLATDEDTLFIGKEESLLNYPARYPNPIRNENLKESFIKEKASLRDRYLSDHLESYKIYHFHDTSVSAPLRSKANINDNKSLKEDGANLPAYLYYLQKVFPFSFKRIERVIHSVVPFFERFDLSYPKMGDKILLEWTEKAHPDIYFNANHLSDGSLRFIALVTLLMQPELPKVIIIDEPELGLHPIAINKLSGLIKSAAAKGCQVIISTQSVTLLNNFEAEDVITVDKENNQSVFRRLDKEALGNWLKDYSIGELWTKSVINGQPI